MVAHGEAGSVPGVGGSGGSDASLTFSLKLKIGRHPARPNLAPARADPAMVAHPSPSPSVSSSAGARGGRIRPRRGRVQQWCHMARPDAALARPDLAMLAHPLPQARSAQGEAKSCSGAGGSGDGVAPSSSSSIVGSRGGSSRAGCQLLRRTGARLAERGLGPGLVRADRGHFLFSFFNLIYRG